MTELKCPFCQQKLQQTYDGKQFWCSNYKDQNHPINVQGTEELWQALIDTKKKLDLANAELDYIKKQITKDKVFEQITQKEEKEDIEFQTSQFVWHLLELVETTSVKLQEKISTLIKENDSIFLENKLKKEEK